jgi:hypothetical protein
MVLLGPYGSVDLFFFRIGFHYGFIQDFFKQMAGDVG